MRFLLFLTGFLMLALTQAFAVSITYTATFSQNDFRFDQINGYDIVECDKCIRYGEIGAPQVLVTSYNFIIPIGQTVESISIDAIQDQQFEGNYDMFPVQPDDYYSLCCNTPTPEWIGQDSTIYTKNDNYPPDIVYLGNTGYFDGANHLACINILPIYYKALDRTLFYHSSITFTLDIGGNSSDLPIYVQQRMRQDQAAYDIILNKTVSNPLDISLYGYKPVLIDTAFVQNIYDYPIYPFLIVTRDSLVNYWNPFVDWLGRKGYQAGILPIETIIGYGIVDDPNLSDHASFLRGYLKYAYLHGTSWIILGGVSEPKEHCIRRSKSVPGGGLILYHPGFKNIPKGIGGQMEISLAR